MTINCKPSVNRFQKMVPEGGFEPPTRGFSILRLVNVFNAIGCKLRSNWPQWIQILGGSRVNRFAPSDPSRVKRGTKTDKRGLARYAAKPKAEEAAEMREALMGHTTFLPQGGL